MNSSILLALLFGANIAYSGCVPTDICVNSYEAPSFSWDTPDKESYKYMCDGTTKIKIDYNTLDCKGNGTSTIIQPTDTYSGYELIDCSGQCEEYIIYKTYDILLNNTNCDGYDSKYYEETLVPADVCQNALLAGSEVTCTDTYVTQKIYWGDVTCDGTPTKYRLYEGCNLNADEDARIYLEVEYCGYISKSNGVNTLISFILLGVVTFIV